MQFLLGFLAEIKYKTAPGSFCYMRIILLLDGILSLNNQVKPAYLCRSGSLFALSLSKKSIHGYREEKFTHMMGKANAV